MSQGPLFELTSWARFYLPGGRWLAPFHRTPEAAQKRILAMAGLDAGSRLVDLGSGDGALLVRAAQQWGCSCTGYELDAGLVAEARAHVERLGLAARCRLVQADFMTAHRDVAAASHVFMYLSDRGNAALYRGLQSSLQPGTRLLSAGFAVPGLQPTLQERCSGLPLFMYDC